MYAVESTSTSTATIAIAHLPDRFSYILRNRVNGYGVDATASIAISTSERTRS